MKTYRECRERFLVEARTLGDQTVLESNERGIEDTDNANGVDEDDMGIVGAVGDGQVVDAVTERGLENAGATVVDQGLDNIGAIDATVEEVALATDIATDAGNLLANTSVSASAPVRNDVGQDLARILTWNVIPQDVEVPAIEIFHGREGQVPPAMVSP